MNKKIEKKLYNYIYIIICIIFNREIIQLRSTEESTTYNNNIPIHQTARTTSQETNNNSFHSAILMSQISQSSDIFSGYAQGLQCIPNSIISLIYHVNKNCELWTLEDIENILRSGNILYKSIGKKTTLLVSDVPQYIKLYNFIYHISEQNSVIGDIFKEDINFNTVPFKKVEPIIVTHKFCVLVIRNLVYLLYIVITTSLYLTHTIITNLGCLILMGGQLYSNSRISIHY